MIEFSPQKFPKKMVISVWERICLQNNWYYQDIQHFFKAHLERQMFYRTKNVFTPQATAWLCHFVTLPLCDSVSYRVNLPLCVSVRCRVTLPLCDSVSYRVTLPLWLCALPRDSATVWLCKLPRDSATVWLCKLPRDSATVWLCQLPRDSMLQRDPMG
jgi:hypothetical protein